MAANLTLQVRDIANVATAVAKGDLTQKITVNVKGELAELKDNLNQMVDSPQYIRCGSNACGA